MALIEIIKQAGTVVVEAVQEHPVAAAVGAVAGVGIVGGVVFWRKRKKATKALIDAKKTMDTIEAVANGQLVIVESPALNAVRDAVNNLNEVTGGAALSGVAK